MEPTILRTDAVAGELLASPLPAHLAYVGGDELPRVVPVAFLWQPDAGTLVVCTEPTTPKVAALRARRGVALTIDTSEPPWKALLIRGTVAIDVVPGVPDEYLAATRKGQGGEEAKEFEAQVRATYTEMARITITPTWAKIMDFTSPDRGPEFLERLAGP